MGEGRAGAASLARRRGPQAGLLASPCPRGVRPALGGAARLPAGPAPLPRGLLRPPRAQRRGARGSPSALGGLALALAVASLRSQRHSFVPPGSGEPQGTESLARAYRAEATPGPEPVRVPLRRREPARGPRRRRWGRRDREGGGQGACGGWGGGGVHNWLKGLPGTV